MLVKPAGDLVDLRDLAQARKPVPYAAFQLVELVGLDAGGEGARTMMLVYNLPSTEAVYNRFGGIDGSAYFIGGFGMTALGAGNIIVVPIRAGVGLRLGANIGYLKFTPKPTWNPF